LAQQYNSFLEKHAKLVVIGSGDPPHLQELRHATGFRGELLTDPSRESFKVLGFASGIGKVMGLKVLSRTFSALGAGHMPGTVQGSALQLGGAVILRPDATIAYYFASAEAGDHPTVTGLLDALAVEKLQPNLNPRES
jgi:peroxiredoxin